LKLLKTRGKLGANLNEKSNKTYPKLLAQSSHTRSTQSKTANNSTQKPHLWPQTSHATSSLSLYFADISQHSTANPIKTLFICRNFVTSENLFSTFPPHAAMKAYNKLSLINK
jgi:hypothetical protein